jgi:hypothetical protein
MGDSRDVHMRDLHHARGCARGHYNDGGGKTGGDEERGPERDRYNEGDRNNDRYRNIDFQRSRVSDRIETGTVTATETGSTR